MAAALRLPPGASRGMIGGMAAAVSLLAHGVWLAPSVRRPETPRPPPSPKVTAYTERLPGGWSPTLFSLPSATGFSGAVRTGDLHALPPLQSPLRLTESLRFPLPPPVIPDPPPLRNVKEIGDSVAAAHAPLVPTLPAAPGAWRLEFPAHSDLRVRQTRLPDQSPGPPGLTLVGEMTFDAGGRVRSLLVHPPVPDHPAVPGMIRSLRRLWTSNPPPGVPLRFRFAWREVAVSP